MFDFDIVSFIPRAVMQGIPLLYGSTGEILTEKSGNLNLGIPGIMYVGGICGVIGAFFYEQAVPANQMSGFLAIMIPMLCSLLGSLLMGLLYCFLTVTLRANQNVTGLTMTTFGVGIGNFFGGSLIKLTGSEVPSIALAATSGYFAQSLPFAKSLGWFGQIHPLVAKNYGVDAEFYCAELAMDELENAKGADPEYVPLPKFPAVTRDIAVVCDRAVTVGALEDCIRRGAKGLLKDVSLFDIYTGSGIPEGKKSVAFNLTLRSDDRSLTAQEADEDVKSILETLKAELNAVLR